MNRMITVMIPEGIVVQVVNGTVTLTGSTTLFKEVVECHSMNALRNKSGKAISESTEPVHKLGRKFRLEGQQKHIIINRYKNGETAQSLAKEFNVCTGTIYGVIRKAK